MCELQDFAKLDLLPYYQTALVKELRFWHRDYLPKGLRGKELEGKEVVDLGAGCGETAQFFLNHGAVLVHCFESNPDAVKCLQKNFGDNPRVRINLSRIGYIKVDIEGAEEYMTVETHFPARWKPFSSGIRVWRLLRTSQLRAFDIYTLHLVKIWIAHKGRLFIDSLKPLEKRKWK